MIQLKTKNATVSALKEAGAGAGYTLSAVPVKAGVMVPKGLFMLFAVFILCWGSARAGQPATAQGQEQHIGCSMDFIYSGSMDQGGDSIFYLHYSFALDKVQHLTRFILKEVKGRELRLENRPGLQGDMQVVNDAGLLRVILHTYDKFNLPVMVRAEDATGTSCELYIRTKTGECLGGEQLRQRIGQSLEPVIYTDPVPVVEPDPSIKNPNPDMP